MTGRTFLFVVAVPVAFIAFPLMGAAPDPKLKPASNVTTTWACPDTGDCWVTATWRLHPSYNASTDSVRLVWTEGTTALATHHTDGETDSIAIPRLSIDRTGSVTATVHRKGVTQASPPVSAPWTVPAIVQPPAPVDSLKTQVGVLVSPASVTLAPSGTQAFCGYALFSDGSREAVSGACS